MEDRQMVWSRFRAAPPMLTVALALSVIVTTAPQFLLGDIYDSLTGTLLGLKVPLYFFLPTFSHSPSILPAHFLGNLVVLLFFGGLTERLLGSRRFSILTLTTLGTSCVLAYARGLDTMHGISGVIWAYHAPVLLYLIARAEQVGWRRLLKKPLTILTLLLFLLNFIGLPLFEVVLLTQRFFENFGQVMHLASVVTALPFIFVWRRHLESGAMGIEDNRERKVRGAHRSIPLLTMAAVLMINLVGSLDAIVQSVGREAPVIATVDPPSGTPASELEDAVTITFDRKMLPLQPESISRSVWYEREPVPEFTYRWLSPKTLTVELSRRLLDGESFKLDFDVQEEGPRGVPLRTMVTLEYAD